ncbi:butyrophilin-like protein 3 [Talpa occidentalis]|uniref:butyrophilin-like protein 3 n=1 Tax=Talpa occidentalis TaxID=50954 RepID=UPI00189076E6|nr:butyrophilin-like protein 3 [Talpa occidentalis]
MAFVFTLVLSLFTLGSGQWQVIGPDKSVKVLVGEDTVFSCFLSPETSAEAMEVRFFRNQFSSVVHLYRDGQDQDDMQLPDFRGRTELVKDSMDYGQVSLRLKNVTALDTGQYGCRFSSQFHYQEATWELQASALGLAPLISILGHGGNIQLLCKSSGWFPQPTVKWKSSQGHDLPSDLKVNTDLQGLFHVETSIRVGENTGNISCSIQHRDQDQDVKINVWIGEMFFQPSPFYLVSIVLGVLCFVLCIGIIVMRITFIKGKIQTELDWRRKHVVAELREAQKHAVEVTLDPDTADPHLYITDLKVVTYKSVPQDVPYSEERFWRECVVASQGFQEGKHYWEVDVACNKQWGLGICRDDVNRKMSSGTLSPHDGYWVLRLNEENEYFIFNPDRIDLSLRIPPTRVGIFLDYEGGTISFFNIDDQSLICTLTHQFDRLLRPYILCEAYGATPIIICPVSQRSEGPHALRYRQFRTLREVTTSFLTRVMPRGHSTSHSPSGH